MKKFSIAFAVLMFASVAVAGPDKSVPPWNDALKSFQPKVDSINKIMDDNAAMATVNRRKYNAVKDNLTPEDAALVKEAWDGYVAGVGRIVRYKGQASQARIDGSAYVKLAATSMTIGESEAWWAKVDRCTNTINTKLYNAMLANDGNYAYQLAVQSILNKY